MGIQWGTPIKISEETTVEHTVSTGNLLARNFAGDPYVLVQLVIDDNVRYDAQRSIPATVSFDFKDGLQETPHPVVVSASGKNLLHAGDIQVFLNGFEADSAPSVKAVISELPIEPEAVIGFDWTGEEPIDNSEGNGIAYNDVDGILYHIANEGQLPGTASGLVLISLDPVDHTEISRVLLEGTAGGSPYFNPLALPGTPYIAVPLEAPTRKLAVYNSLTGEEVASWPEDADATMSWRAVMPYKSKYLFLGVNVKSSSPHYRKMYVATVDPIGGTIVVSRQAVVEWDSVQGVIFQPGRNSLAFTSFFALGNLRDLYELRWDGASLEMGLLVTFEQDTRDCLYDGKTELVICPQYTDFVSTGRMIKGINPDTGAEEFSYDTTVRLDGAGVTAFNIGRFWPIEGFIFFRNGLAIYLFDIEARQLSLWATITNADAYMVIHQLGSWFYYERVGEIEWREVQIAKFEAGYVPLDTVLTRILALSGWQPEDLTFDGLSVVGVPGFVIDRDTNASTPVSLLSQIFDFSFTDIGSGMYFQKAVRDLYFTPDAVIDYDELERIDGKSIATQDEPDSRTPSTLILDYISIDSGYQRRQVSSIRPGGVFDVTESLREETISAPVVLFDDDAIELVHERHFSLLEFQRIHSFALPKRYMRLVPGNILQINRPDDTPLVVEITKIGLGTGPRMAVECRDFQSSVSTSVATDGAEPLLPGASSNGYASRYIDIDSALVADGDDTGGDGLRRYGVLTSRGQAGWPGATKREGNAPADLAISMTQSNSPVSIIGSALNALGSPESPWLIDEDNTLTLQLSTAAPADLESVTTTEMLAGANRFYLGKPGRWEILHFRDAVVNDDATVTLSGLIRGWRGTDANCDNHQVGDEFYLYDPDTLHRQIYSPDFLNTLRYYKAVGIGFNPTIGVAEVRTIEGNAERPYAPVNLAAEISGPDVLIEFDWRSRLNHLAILTGDADTVFGEAEMAFEIDIWNGSGVLRTLEAATNSVVYSAADIATDFGSIPATLTFDVYQLSAQVGRGYAGTATITL